MQRIYSVDENKVGNFPGLQQQHKQLDTIEMAYSGPIIYDKEYVYQFQLGPTHKIQQQQRY